MFQLVLSRRGSFRVAEFGQHSRPEVHAQAFTGFKTRDECSVALVQFCIVFHCVAYISLCDNWKQV